MTTAKVGRTLEEFQAELLRDPEQRAAAKKIHVSVGVANAVTIGRARKGWNQSRLALETNLPVSLIAAIESGRDNSTVETLTRLAEALEVSFVIEPWVAPPRRPPSTARPAARFRLSSEITDG
jgi:transcriptional regulator with XRE-family HTH domain